MRPRKAKKRICVVGPTQQRRDVDRRADPREERAEADRAADEEDAEPGLHVSESVARSRASAFEVVEEHDRERGVGDAQEQRTRAAACRPSPPIAARRTARMPQVGASAQAIGLRPSPGSSESGISIPVIVQTGTRAPARTRSPRGRGRASRRARARAGRSRATAAGIETDEEQRVRDVQRHAEEQPPPEERRGDRVDADAGDRDGDRREHEDRAATGAATSSSSIPHQRCCWIAPPALVAVVDQIPITAAPSAA